METTPLQGISKITFYLVTQWSNPTNLFSYSLLLYSNNVYQIKLWAGQCFFGHHSFIFGLIELVFLWWCTFDGGQPSMKDYLWWMTTFDDGQPLMEDDPWWKMTFDRKQPLIEDNLWWRMTFNERQPLMKDELWWENFDLLTNFLFDDLFFDL